MKRTAKFSITIPSEAAKKARMCVMKCLSSSARHSPQQPCLQVPAHTLTFVLERCYKWEPTSQRIMLHRWNLKACRLNSSHVASPPHLRVSPSRACPGTGQPPLPSKNSLLPFCTFQKCLGICACITLTLKWAMKLTDRVTHDIRLLSPRTPRTHLSTSMSNKFDPAWTQFVIFASQ